MSTSKQIIYFKSGDIKKFISDLKEQKETFSVHATAYSQKIETEKIKYFFTPEKNSAWLFSANQKIKSDIEKCNIEIDITPQNLIKYYLLNQWLKDKSEFYLPEVFNVDIKSAYPSTLKKLGFITEKTFSYLHETPPDFSDLKRDRRKTERLKSVGMIATEKMIYYYEQGEYINCETKLNQRGKNIFNLVCFTVGEIMSNIAGAYQDDFLFFWVDGIYLKSNTDRATEILIEAGYEYSEETLKEFIIKREENYISISFLKDGKQKIFNIPVLNYQLIANYNYLKTLNKTA